MKYILFVAIFCLSVIPLVDAIETEVFTWKFCDGVKQFDYSITNGTLHDTAHLQQFGVDNCKDDKYTTDYQLQLFHTSNNQTDFTIMVPDDLKFEKIDVRVIGSELEKFQLNNTSRSIEFSDFIHDKHGIVTVILDFKGLK